MPKNQLERMMFALLTVVVTVHAYVFYSLYVVNGPTLMAVTGASGVLAAIRAQGGVYMLGRMMPIWGVVLVEFLCAYGLEVLMGSPCSFRLAASVFSPADTLPAVVELSLHNNVAPSMSVIAYLYLVCLDVSVGTTILPRHVREAL